MLELTQVVIDQLYEDAVNQDIDETTDACEIFEKSLDQFGEYSGITFRRYESDVSDADEVTNVILWSNPNAVVLNDPTFSGGDEFSGILIFKR